MAIADVQQDIPKLVAEIEALEGEISANAARNIHGFLTADHDSLDSPRPRIEPVGNPTRNAFRSVHERLASLGILDLVLDEYARFFIDDQAAVVALRQVRALLSKPDGVCPTCGEELLPGDPICADCRDL